MGKYFGTDGIRGIVGEDLTDDFTERLGLAVGSVLASQNSHSPTVVIGRDTRASGTALKEALTRGLCRAGANVVCAGILPTAAVALLTARHSLDAGIVISASHNPHAWNGIKFFDCSGFKLSDDLETAIEAAIDSSPRGATVPGEARVDSQLMACYTKYLLDACEGNLRSFSLVVDCANGAASNLAPHVFEAAGATVCRMNVEPNGVNINQDCGALHPGTMARTVVERGATMGVAFDGDADRVIFSDECGHIIGGDQVLAMCAADRVAHEALPGRLVVGTELSSLALELALKDLDCTLARTRVGDRFVLEEMQRLGATLGGEPSGHTIFLDTATTGDGILTAIMVVNLMVRSGRCLSELAAVMQPVPQASVNVPICRRAGNGNNPATRTNSIISDTVRSARERLGENGRIIVRPSGTEPVVRVLVEGPDAVLVKQLAHELAQTIETQWR